MKSKPNTTPKYSAFSNASRKVLRISHSDMKAKLDAEKQAKDDSLPLTLQNEGSPEKRSAPLFLLPHFDLRRA